MKAPDRPKEYCYVGALAEVCRGLVAEKRAAGLKYDCEAKRLGQMCRASLNYDVHPKTLPEAFVREWISKTASETESNRHLRYNTARILAQYMKRLGYEAFCPEKEDVGKFFISFTPYIFTHDEIRRFFEAANDAKREKYSASPRYHIVMPIFMRMLYCCGMRVSEVAGLYYSDVDLDEGILTVRASKQEKSRYVPMPDELVCVLRKYAQTRLKREVDSHFFTPPDGGVYSHSSVYRAFRRFLRNAGISHGGKGKGPRLHDLRHSFAVHSLQKFISDGKDVTAMLPKLSAYLGHVSLRYTEPYVRLTAEAYPEISALLQEKYGKLIPHAVNYDEND
jgi:integrase